MFSLEYKIEKADENSYVTNKLQNLEEMRNTSPPDEHLNNGFSNEIEEKLGEINNYENKINDLLLKKITEFIKENKELTEISKSSQIDLNRVQTSMKNVLKDVEYWKENYRILELKYKDLSVKLQNTNKLNNNDAIDHSVELPIKNRKLTNENNSIRAYCIVEGSLVI